MAALRILIVDDEEGLLTILSRALEEAGHRTRTAESAEAGLALARANSFDAILLDINLPNMTGLRALQEFAACSKAPIFLMSGHTDSEIEKDALLLGARALLSKPFDIEDLNAELAKLPGA